jgi:hypothetical protein
MSTSSSCAAIVSASLASIWILLISLPFSLPATTKANYQESGAFTTYLHAMLHVFFLPVAFGLIQARAIPFKILALVFLVSVMGSLGQQVHLPRPELRADWRHPPLFLAGHRILQVICLEAPVFLAEDSITKHFGFRLPVEAIGVTALWLWAFAFAWQGRLAASPIAVCFRLVAPLVVLSHMAIPFPGHSLAIAGFVAGLCCASIGSCVQVRRDQQELLQAWPKLAPSFARLRVRLRKVLRGRKLPLPLLLPQDTSVRCPSGGTFSVGSFARALLQVETYLGAEHLEEKFLSAKRPDWKLALERLMSRTDPRLQPYDQLQSLSDDLACNVVVAPLTPTTLIAMLRSGSAKRIPEPVWWKIMHFCFDCKTIALRSFALTHISSIDDGVLCQMERARVLANFAMSMASPSDLQFEWAGVRTVAFNNQKKEISFIPDGLEQDYCLDYNTKHSAISQETRTENIGGGSAQPAAVSLGREMV